MELSEYKSQFINDVLIKSSEEQLTKEAAFISEIIDITPEGDFENDFFNLYVTGPLNPNKKFGKMHADGGVIERATNTIRLIFADYDESGSGILNREMIYNGCKQMLAFVTNSVKGYFDDSEESAPETQFGTNIKNNFLEIHKVELYYVSNKCISDRFKSVVEFEPINIYGHEIVVDVKIIDINYIYNMKRNGLKREPIVIDTKEFNCVGIPCLKAEVNTNEYDAYLAVVPGLFLDAIYKKYGARLLEGNVRSFLSVRRKVNKSILQTIVNKPGYFFSYNNGICTTAKDINIVKTPEGLKITKFTDLQIINGGQTTAMLAYADIKKGVSLKDVYVQMKLTLIDDVQNNLVRNISRYANNQNKVSAADLVSNHEYYVQIERFANQITPSVKANVLRPTKWFFERSRGAYDQRMMKMTKGERKRFKDTYPKNQKFTKVELAKYINTIDLKPHHVSWGNQVNLTKFQETMEKQWDKDKTIFNVDYFKRLIAAAILFKETTRIISQEDWYIRSRSDRAELITYTIAKLLYECEKFTNKSFDFMTIWNNQSVPETIRLELKNISYFIYKVFNKPDRERTVREYCKREKCWDDVKKEKYELTAETIATLIDKKYEKAQKISAKKQQKFDNNVDVVIKIYKIGSAKWDELILRGNQQQLLDEKEINLLKKASDYCKNPAKSISLLLGSEIWRIYTKLKANSID